MLRKLFSDKTLRVLQIIKKVFMIFIGIATTIAAVVALFKGSFLLGVLGIIFGPAMLFMDTVYAAKEAKEIEEFEE